MLHHTSKQCLVGSISQRRFFSSLLQKKWASRLESFSQEFTPLALQHKAINLGQGFPDFEGPDFILKSASLAVANHFNQYSRSQGHQRLVNAIAKYYSPLLQRDIDPLKEIVITIGATEGLFSTIQSFVNPGDEVIMIEPFYDTYPNDVIMAGGIPKYIPLRFPKDCKSSSEWKIEQSDLEKAVSPKTKMIIVNTPQNIPGKVYNWEELQMIADFAKKYDLLVLSDEVYEPMVYGENKHIKMASLPGMFERTITLGSAGKSFSVTGWKTGWVIAPAHLAEAIWLTHTNTSFCSITPLQEAIGSGFEQCMNERKDYFPELKNMLERKRDKLCSALKSVGLNPIVPQGSYFVLASFENVKKEQYFNPKDKSRTDYQFCRWLTKNIGVAAIPPTAFYSAQNAHISEHLARFCFIKRDETIDEAIKRLQKLKTL